MANLVIDTYTYVLTKTKVNTYTLLAPASVPVAGILEVYSLSTSGVLSIVASHTINPVVADTTYTFELEEGTYILKFDAHHGSNHYYTLLTSYKSKQSCLLEVTKNLLASDLCKKCGDYDWCQTVALLLTARQYFILVNDLFGTVFTDTDDIVNITEITADSDLLYWLKLANRIDLYCDDCLKTPCGC